VSSNILLVGSRGFIGRHVLGALEAAGHRVHRADRPGVDLARDVTTGPWLSRLHGIDVVVNAAGIFRETPAASFDAVHARGPSALFEACARARIKVVQVSALGADAGATTAFLRTKHEADEALLALDVPSIVLQPSLVYGAGGASTSLLEMLASLPWIPLPGAGEQRIQPVAVEDIAAAVACAIAADRFPRARVPVVGPEALTLRAYLASLRDAMRMGPARFIAIAPKAVRFAARLHLGLLDRDSLAMLEQGNTASVAPLRALLGRDPVPVPAPMHGSAAAMLRTRAKLGWLLPLLRMALAFMWFAAGIVSAGVYPVGDSLELLARTGLHGVVARATLYGASALDVAMGIATLVGPRRALWLAQAVLILAYTAIITVFLPEQWLHPYGAVVKNVPILALLLVLHQLEKR